MAPSPPPSARTPRSDAACVAAVDVARGALLEVVDPAVVGEHLGARAEGERLVTHVFESTQAGYRGWHWSVTVTRASRQRAVTVDEIVLLPGDDAIVAPSWTPYKERIQPGDMSPGDLLPPEDDDPRLVPGYLAGDPEVEALVDASTVRSVAQEVGFGREQVLSVEGRDAAADRWYDSDHGPDAPIAKQAPGECRTCGFMVRLSGPLASLFGVCANAMANDDGRVVAYDHGCGAHSQARLGRSAGPAPIAPPVFDTMAVDDVERF
ncbi:MAG: DUF3027 domain-containing protein [Nocardioidaceae bacterium]